MIMMYKVKGMREYNLRKAATKAVAVVLNTTWGAKNKRAFRVRIRLEVKGRGEQEIICSSLLIIFSLLFSIMMSISILPSNH